MASFPALPALMLLLALANAQAQAVELGTVELEGIDGVLAANVRAKLSLDRVLPPSRGELTETRLAYLLRVVPAEVRSGLEPYGFYDAQVTADVERSGNRVDVRLRIVPGEPVRVRALDVQMQGPAHDDAVVAAKVEGFRPAKGELLHHAAYESSKAGVGSALSERGYFDAELETHRVEVTRAMGAADIAVAWRSGRRYALGAVRFEGQQLRPGILDALVPWRAGEPYDQKQLLALQQSLSETDYFSGISLLPEPERAVGDQVPIKVTLVPNKRSVYNLGLRYGTDSGAGINARLERRWLNDRGHKLLAELNLAQFKSDLTLVYRIPAFRWLDGWYSFSAGAREEQIQDVTSQYVDVAATRSGRWRDWNLLAGLNFKRERYDRPDVARVDYATLVYPSIWGQWRQADDLITPTRGFALTLELRGGVTGLGSDLNFLQARADARWIRSLGASNRVLLRGEVGSTWSDRFAEFPPSMRFYAGGDRNLRGYGYKEIGQRVGDQVFGGRHLAVVSAELEHMFTPIWGGAVFVDAGDAFDTRLEAEVGVGLGLRWRSPVGPVRVDVAHGIGTPEQSVRLHVTVGPDL